MKRCIKCLIEKEIISFREKRNSCKECEKEYSKIYNKTDKAKASQIKFNKSDKRKEIDRKYTNSINWKTKRRAYRLSEEWIASELKYRNTDKWKESVRIACANRRAAQRTTSDWTITITTVTLLLNQQWGVCAMCWIDITNREDRHLDHIYPLSKWGKHTLNNIQWLCCTCNLVKSDKILINT